jgi:hypothetical protein
MRNTNRCIKKRPKELIYYLVDANFLLFRFVNPRKITDSNEKRRAELARHYWKQIDAQMHQHSCKVLILDICIAEVFKTFAKKYYDKAGIFPKSVDYRNAREGLRNMVQLGARDASKTTRVIRCHDIQTNRDIVLGVDRYFEKVHKHKRKVSIVDLLILSTAQYLIDFLGFDRDRISIITMDGDLYKLARSVKQLPAAFNPENPQDLASKVFV